MSENQSRSVIDYVLTDVELYHKTLEMCIDDTGERWTVGADHSVIQVQFRRDIFWRKKRQVQHDGKSKLIQIGTHKHWRSSVASDSGWSSIEMRDNMWSGRWHMISCLR